MPHFHENFVVSSYSKPSFLQNRAEESVSKALKAENKTDKKVLKGEKVLTSTFDESLEKKSKPQDVDSTPSKKQSSLSGSHI